MILISLMHSALNIFIKSRFSFQQIVSCYPTKQVDKRTLYVHLISLCNSGWQTPQRNQLKFNFITGQPTRHTSAYVKQAIQARRNSVAATFSIFLHRGRALVAQQCPFDSLSFYLPPSRFHPFAGVSLPFPPACVLGNWV